MEVIIYLSGYPGGSIAGQTCNICHSVIAPSSEFPKHELWHKHLYNALHSWRENRPARKTNYGGGRKKMKESEKARPNINIRRRKVKRGTRSRT